MSKKRKPIQVSLNEDERSSLDALTKEWGCSHAATFRRLLREHQQRTNGDLLHPTPRKS
jgi:hypothetical protein